MISDGAGRLEIPQMYREIRTEDKCNFYSGDTMGIKYDEEFNRYLPVDTIAPEVSPYKNKGLKKRTMSMIAKTALLATISAVVVATVVSSSITLFVEQISYASALLRFDTSEEAGFIEEDDVWFFLYKGEKIYEEQCLPHEDGSLMMENLEPGTTYRVEVTKNGEKVGETSFRTLDYGSDGWRPIIKSIMSEQIGDTYNVQVTAEIDPFDTTIKEVYLHLDDEREEMLEKDGDNYTALIEDVQNGMHFGVLYVVYEFEGTTGVVKEQFFVSVNYVPVPPEVSEVDFTQEEKTYNVTASLDIVQNDGDVQRIVLIVQGNEYIFEFNNGRYRTMFDDLPSGEYEGTLEVEYTLFGEDGMLTKECYFTVEYIPVPPEEPEISFEQEEKTYNITAMVDIVPNDAEINRIKLIVSENEYVFEEADGRYTAKFDDLPSGDYEGTLEVEYALFGEDGMLTKECSFTVEYIPVPPEALESDFRQKSGTYSVDAKAQFTVNDADVKSVVLTLENGQSYTMSGANGSYTAVLSNVSSGSHTGKVTVTYQLNGDTKTMTSSKAFTVSYIPVEPTTPTLTLTQKSGTYSVDAKAQFTANDGTIKSVVLAFENGQSVTMSGSNGTYTATVQKLSAGSHTGTVTVTYVFNGATKTKTASKAITVTAPAALTFNSLTAAQDSGAYTSTLTLGYTKNYSTISSVEVTENGRKLQSNVSGSTVKLEALPVGTHSITVKINYTTAGVSSSASKTVSLEVKNLANDLALRVRGSLTSYGGSFEYDWEFEANDATDITARLVTLDGSVEIPTEVTDYNWIELGSGENLVFTDKGYQIMKMIFNYKLGGKSVTKIYYVVVCDGNSYSSYPFSYGVWCDRSTQENMISVNYFLDVFDRNVTIKSARIDATDWRDPEVEDKTIYTFAKSDLTIEKFQKMIKTIPIDMDTYAGIRAYLVFVLDGYDIEICSTSYYYY